MYFMQQNGCEALIEQVLPSHDIYDFQQQLCDMIFVEASQHSKHSRVADHKQDLFLEQGKQQEVNTRTFECKSRPTVALH